ncbi:MAG: transcriptional repressor [Eubacteriales bacterium]|nr:transcriptional repressor [Eubacteriales bacterium]
MTKVNGYKTSSRTKIMDYLIKNNNKTVSVSDINLHLKDIGCPVNLTTIYRYMDKLTTDGTVKKYVSEKGNKATFQYVERGNKCDQHLHLKCTECGTVIHLDCHFMDEIAEHIQKDHDFNLKCKNSILFGTCKSCKAKIQQNDKI